MEVGWLAPFVVLIAHYWWQRLDVALLHERGVDEVATALAQVQTMPPVALFLLLFGTLIFYMLVADLLNQWQVDSPQREVIMGGVVLATSLLSVRLLLYPRLAPWDLRWLGETGSAVFNFQAARLEHI